MMFVGSHQNKIGSPRVIVPSTSRPSILQNASSGYKDKRRRRAKQLVSLHMDILEDFEKWRDFQFILQHTMGSTGVTNATVKACLFDALETHADNNSCILRYSPHQTFINQSRSESNDNLQSRFCYNETNDIGGNLASCEEEPVGTMSLKPPKNLGCSVLTDATVTSSVCSTSSGHDSVSLSSNPDEEYASELVEYLSEMNDDNDHQHHHRESSQVILVL